MSKQSQIQKYLVAENYVISAENKQTAYATVSKIIEMEATPKYKQYGYNYFTNEQLLDIPWIVPIIGDKGKVQIESEVITNQLPIAYKQFVDTRFDKPSTIIGGGSTEVRPNVRKMLLPEGKLNLVGVYIGDPSDDQAYMNYIDQGTNLGELSLAMMSVSVYKDSYFPTTGIVKLALDKPTENEVSPWIQYIQLYRNKPFDEWLNSVPRYVTGDKVPAFFDHLRSRLATLLQWAAHPYIQRPLGLQKLSLEKIMPVSTIIPFDHIRSSSSNAMSYRFLSLVVQALGSDAKNVIKMAIPDMKRYNRLISATEQLWDTFNPKIWSSIKHELKLIDGWYCDKKYGTPIICEHILSKDPVVSHGKAIDNSSIICDVCGKELWRNAFDEREMGDATRYKDEIYSVLEDILAHKVLITTTNISTISNVVSSIIGDPIAKEIAKIKNKTIEEYQYFSQFVVIAATISFCNQVSLRADNPNFKFKSDGFTKLLRSEYIQFILKLGMSLPVAEERILSYWKTGLSPYFNDPDGVLDGAIPMLSIGIRSEKEELLNEVYIMSTIRSMLKQSAQSKRLDDITTDDFVKCDLPKSSFAKELGWAKQFVEFAQGKGNPPIRIPIPRSANYHRTLFKASPIPKRMTHSTLPTTIDDKGERAAFDDAIRWVCPSRKKALLPHEFEKRICKHCGIGEDIEIHQKYYNMHRKFILERWISPTVPMESPYKTPSEKKIPSVKLDGQLNKTQINEFEKKNGIVPTNGGLPYLYDLASIAVNLGLAVLSTPIKNGEKKAIITAINRMTDPKNNADWLTRQTLYLRINAHYK
jgi:hypothetical protein